MNSNLNDNARTLWLDCQRLAIYHQLRRQFFENCHRWILFIVTVAGGSTIVSSLSTAIPYLTIVSGIVVTVGGAFDLAFAFANRARDHEFLYRRYVALASSIEVADGDSTKIPTWRTEIIQIHADAPPEMRALDFYAYNMLMDSIGHSESRIPLKFWQRLFKNVLSFAAAKAA